MNRDLPVAVTRGADLEERAPTASTMRLRWQHPTQPMRIDWNAGNAVKFGYLANVVAARCCDIIADAVSSLPVRAGVVQPARPGESAEWNPNARAARLLGPPPGGPNPGWSARLWVKWMVIQHLATGRGAAEIETVGAGGRGEVAALWPLVTSQLRAYPTTAGVDWFAGYEYGPEHEARRLAAAQVFDWWRPHPTDPRQPYSPLEPAAYPLAVALMGDRYQHAFLANGAVPAALVTTVEFPDEQARTRFRSQWESRYRGPDQAGKVAFSEVSADGSDRPVGHDIDVKVLGLSHDDAQFAEMHKRQLEMISIALGVPWSRLDASGRTFDNAEQEDRSFWTDTVLPLCVDLQDAINMRLAPRLGPEVVWFDLSGVDVLRPKPAWNPAQAVLLVRDRIITPNESRAALGLPPIDGGDVLVDRPAPVAAGQVPTPNTGMDTTSEGEPDMRAAPPPVEVRVPDGAELEARRARLWNTANAVAETLEARWQRAFARLFARQSSATVSRLEGNRGRRTVESRTPDAGEVFDRVFWEEQTRQLADDLYEQVVASAMARVSDQFAAAFDLEAPFVAEFVSARSNQLAGEVTATTYESIQHALIDGIGEGDSIPDLAARVRDVFEDAAGRRAEVIARTEVVSAYNGSAVAAASTLPRDVVAGQEWIATRDGRVRPEHSAADGQVVSPGARFTVGADMLAYPGDPNGQPGNTIQCRCTVAFLTPEDMESLGYTQPSVPVSRALQAIASVEPGDRMVESRVRRALEVAA